MKRLLYIVLALATLASCSGDLGESMQGECELVLDLGRVGVARTRAIDNDLALKILDSKGELYVQYPAGSVPRRIVLAPGTFTVQAYTDNQSTWSTANDGRGEACYWGSTQVEMTFDATTYCNMQVPMTNYAVTLSLPEMFTTFFPQYRLTLKSGFSEVWIQEGEKAYFSTQSGGFTYRLSATNTDQNTHQTSTFRRKEVEAGKLYNITYYYGTPDNSGGLDIEIKDNMEDEDVSVPL